MIPVLRPTIDEKTAQELLRVLESGWWGCGEKTAEFERRFAEKVGAQYAIGTSSATAALDLCLKAHAIRSGELIVPALTFVADAAVGDWNNMDVTLADVEEDSHCLDPEAIVLTQQTRAVIVVNLHGRLANVQRLRERFTGLIIEDNAHAMFTPGTCRHSDVAVWSFHAVKTMPAGDGGMVTTNDRQIAERVRSLSSFGMTRRVYERASQGKYDWDYDILEGGGLKAYMNDITAVLGLGQLARIEQMNARRRFIQAYYNAAFRDLPGVQLPPYSHTVQHYVLRSSNRAELSEFLAQRNIATAVHYKPLSEMTYWKKAVKRPLPVTGRVWPQILTLPVHDALTDEQVVHITDSVRRFFGRTPSSLPLKDPALQPVQTQD